jgi:hypothetical protein
MCLLILTPDSQTKLPKRKWPLLVVLLAAVILAAAFPIRGRLDLVIRPFVVIALLLFLGAKIDSRR